MKRRYILIIVFLTILLHSCSDVLDIPTKNFISDEQLWRSTANADLFLNDIYEQLPGIQNTEQHLDQYSDNSDIGVLRHDGYRHIGLGQITPESFPDGSGFWNWTNRYSHIRRCNLFITKVTESDLPDDYKKKRLAEARFLRAYFYHYLWMAYGGTPLITKVLNNQKVGEEIEYPRVTADEMFTFITNELEEIYKDLDIKVSGANKGRATQGAALTLKAWCELFQASPLRNPNNDKERWRKAANTYQKVIDLGAYQLVDDFNTLFLEENNEVIFVKQYGPGKGMSIEGKMGPVRIGNLTAGWGNFQPTQDLVDDFSMENGKTIDESGSNYDANNPYIGREKRFYQTIIYNNSIWHGEIIRTCVGGENEINLGYNSDNTHTGYYARKRLNESKALGAYHDNKSYQDYIIFRYADVLLAYAEAENEANGVSEKVLAAVNSVRTRNGNLPTIEDTYGSVSQEKLRNIIHRERRVELCFEDKRWWDILRLEIAEKMPDGSPGVMNRPLRGMLITENADGTFKYEIKEVRKRIFLHKMYLMPIPQKALDRNSAMSSQNGGTDEWKNGQNKGYY